MTDSNKELSSVLYDENGTGGAFDSLTQSTIRAFTEL